MGSASLLLLFNEELFDNQLGAPQNYQPLKEDLRSKNEH